MTNPDLNLLRIFDLLFEERSVSRAAQRLNLTQSAVSHALKRLREVIGDPLFTRGANGLSPTARAEELAPQLREILVRIRTALTPPAFAPGASQRTFTIATGSYICRLVVPHLIVMMRASAPGIRLRIVNIDQALLDELDQGTVDVAVGSFGDVPARIRVQPLFRDMLVWVSSRHHPLANAQPDGRTLAAEPSLSIMPDYPFRPLRSDGAGERMTRRTIIGNIGESPEGNYGDVPARVYDVDTATAVVGRTDLFAILPRRLAAVRAKEEGLHLYDTPTAAPDIELALLWHSRFSEDPGLTWLRSLIVNASPE